MTRILSFASVATCIFVAGCATTYIKPSTTQNPPPAEKFSTFSRFELKPVDLSSTYAGDEANQKARAKIQEYFDQRVKPTITEWNAKAGQDGGRTLSIEPRIEHIKFIGIGARIWVGPLAGSSAVIMKVRYVDQSTGKAIAEPEFFQRAAAWSGAFTMGGQDNAMLARIVTLAADYNTKNYGARVGGESGATADLVAAAN